jgi:hypothetical protein
MTFDQARLEARDAASAATRRPEDRSLRTEAIYAAWTAADADPNRRHLTAGEAGPQWTARR